MSDINILPKPFLKRINQIFPQDLVNKIISGLSQNRPTTFRTNILKATTEEIKKVLDSLCLKYQTFDWYKDAFILEDDKKKLIETDLYANGMIYIQSLASMLPPLILEPKSGESVLDLAAAPGSKTSEIAALMKNQGKILANDRHLIRLEKLKYNLKKLGVQNTTVMNIQGQTLGQKYPNQFDKTLLDAPCSLEGTFNTNNPKSYQNWSEELVEALSQRQKELLLSAYKATKVGGTIVYSTCTLSVEENEEVVNSLIEKVGSKVVIEKITLQIPEAIPGFVSINGKNFNSDLKNTIRILPSKHFEGFFLAKLTKIS